MIIGRIARFVVRHLVGAWFTICLTPLLFAAGLDEGEAADTYQIGAITLLFAVPILVVPLAVATEWICRNRQWRRTGAFLSRAVVAAGVLVAGTILENGDIVFAGNVLFACVIIYWLVSNGVDILILKAISCLKTIRGQKREGPNQASEATSEPAPGAASSSPQG